MTPERDSGNTARAPHVRTRHATDCCGQALEAARKARAELTYDQVKRLRHVDTECKNLRRHWALLREALREELLWGPGKLSELRDACVRLVQSVSGAAEARSSAEEAASRERFKVEQLRNEMQQVGGNVCLHIRVFDACVCACMHVFMYVCTGSWQHPRLLPCAASSA